jgi:hypothetical protein
MIKELLPSGKDNAIQTKELMKLCGLDKRQMIKQIHKERAAGAVICSTTAGAGGYYMPASLQEAQECLDSMESRGKSIFSCIKALRDYVKQIEGQECLDLDNKRE